MTYEICYRPTSLEKEDKEDSRVWLHSMFDDETAFSPVLLAYFDFNCRARAPFRRGRSSGVVALENAGSSKKGGLGWSL